MHIPEAFEFTLSGFSPKRVGYALSLLSSAFLPVHSYVSCEMSSLICGFAVILFLAVAALSFVSPRGTPYRFRPLGFAFLAFVANSCSAH